MKLIYITAHPPFPPHRGDQLIAYEQIRRLGNIHEIYLVSYITREVEKKVLELELGEYCKGIFFIKTRKALFTLSVLKTFFNGKPMQVNYYSNLMIKKKISKIIKKINPDLIHIQTVRLADLIDGFRIPKVLDMIDILSLNMKRRALKENTIMKTVLKMESRLLQKYERKLISNFDAITVVSGNDLVNAGIIDRSKIKINPNGTSLIDKVSDISWEEKQDIIIFHGNMSYFPNIEAMISFVGDVWEEIALRYPAYKLFIVGKDPDEKIQKLNGKNNVVVTGYVEDIAEYLKIAKIGIYPMNSGTGMQNKILEALACGVPSIASDFAIQGIQGISENEIIIANTKEQYISALIDLLENLSSWEKYSSNGRAFINQNYSWENNVSVLQAIWASASSHC